MLILFELCLIYHKQNFEFHQLLEVETLANLKEIVRDEVLTLLFGSSLPDVEIQRIKTQYKRKRIHKFDK